MKRLLFWILLTVLVAPLASATTNYINNGLVSVMSPPMAALQIDASNFVNNGTFFITNNNSTLPYETWNTRNWTNANRMGGDSGFRFDYFDSVGQTNGWSANFQNADNANPTNANIFGASYVLVAATNINNQGTMIVNGPGLMTLNGRSIDLTRGTLGAVGNETNDAAGVLDLYWGVNSGLLFGPFASSNVSSSMPVTTIQNNRYVTIGQNLQLTNGFNTYIMTNVFGPSIQAIDVLFLRQTNPAITTEVRFGPSFGLVFGPGVEKIVQWQALLTNRVTGAISTNLLYLDDTFGEWLFFPPALVASPRQTFHPSNYAITHVAPPGYATDTLMTPVALDPSIFVLPTFSTNAGYAAMLTASAFNPDPTIQGSTYTNVPGRIEITASGSNSYLDLTRTLLNGESYLLLSSTNHFVGSTNAVIVSPISDIYLSSTNGMMAISNLTTPFIPRMVGEIQVWSGRWTNTMLIGTNLVATYYNVTMIDSALLPQGPSQIQNLSLRSTNLLIGDALNVFNSLLLDTLYLTISTNAIHAPTPQGEVNLTSGDLWWSASLPNLQCLTNNGKISSINSIYFALGGTPPWFGGFTNPYQSFVTHGSILSAGCSIWANYLEASGTNDTGIGPLSAQADFAIVTNGAFLATDADITFTCGSLLISNQVLEAGRSISLTVTNYLDDGSLSNSVDMIANQNTWTAGAGINLYLLPPQASLLATTVTNTAFPNAPVDNYWAGKDKGSGPGGFVNNAALGRLILDGQDEGSLFNFFRTGLTNALYVDLIEFKDAATNFVSGSVAGTLAALEVNLDTNFTIYYGDAIINGRSIAEKLNGGYGLADTNGGRFFWVSNYSTGFFSSTNVIYSDGSGTNRLNRALVTSRDIDSNGNGIPNWMDGNPVPVAPGIMVQPQGQNVNQGSSAIFTVVATGSPVPAYQWRLNGANIGGATASSYTRSNVQLGDVGSYSVVISNSTGRVTSQDAILNVPPMLTVVFTNHPTRSVVLSWNTIPLASNFLYTASSLPLPVTNWQPVTNFLSGATLGSRATVTYPIGTNRASYYRVRVQSP